MSFYDDASLVLIPSGVKTSKVYSQKPTSGTGDLTFTRASTATRTNASGVIESVASNVPRLDYSGGATCPRLLLEPQRTNLVLRSEEFDTWTQIAITVTANTTTSPDGTTDADTISIGVDGSAARHRLYQITTLTIGTTYTGTYYLKANAHNWIQIVAVSGFSSDVWANFNLANGTIGNTGGVGTTASIENVGNGWYRCRVSGVATGTSSTGFEILVINNTNGARYPSYQSTQAEDVCYVWGAQLEVGSFVSSYIPTTTAAVTRLADACSKTGISSLIGQTEGVVFWNFYVPSLASAGTFSSVIINDGTSSNQFTLVYYSNGRISFNSLVGGTFQCFIDLTSFNLSVGNHKFAFAYKLNDYAAYVDGALVATDTSGTVPATSSINMYNTIAGSLQHKQLALFPTRLTNAQLAELTTL